MDFLKQSTVPVHGNQDQRADQAKLEKLHPSQAEATIFCIDREPPIYIQQPELTNSYT